MKRQKRSYSFDNFDFAEGAFDLFQNSIRSSMDYDANISDQFIARVLTRPTLLTENPKNVKFNLQTGKSQVFVFMVRIEGSKSPHRFLPDPCKTEYTKTSQGRRLAFNLIQQHTKVYMYTSADSELPNIDDRVNIILDRGDFGSFKTDVAKQFVSIAERVKTPRAGIPSCVTLIDTFSTADILESKIAERAGVFFLPGGYLNSEYLFAFISGAEGDIDSFNTGTAGASATFAFPPGKTKISELTIKEIVDAQTATPRQLFAVGKYQIIPDTMTGFLDWVEANRGKTFDTITVTSSYDPNTQLFDENFQDLFPVYLLEDKSGRGAIKSYVTGGGSSLEDAALALAQEFASIGVPFDIPEGTYKPYPTKDIVKNNSFYVGVGGNEAFTATEDIQEILQAMLAANSP
jgi:hypothetical protein